MGPSEKTTKRSVWATADNLNQMVVPPLIDQMEFEASNAIIKHRMLTKCVDEAYRAWRSEPASSARKSKMEQNYQSAALANRSHILILDAMIGKLGYIPKIG